MAIAAEAGHAPAMFNMGCVLARLRRVPEAREVRHRLISFAGHLAEMLAMTIEAYEGR